ncbi:hypothetical protein EGM88_10020 [Aureibaculum marinum]|uniref:Lipoprotein n=1 Tax=Aureibaculum marinum TaxID=2487930 RepID=A0A3N4NUH3_9FLAO|nr:hypothetical protein [Aureibaculum marinum]RPD96686.1 hypothetical protein EGM88_10020 [Aureibaculum marinum]
MKTLVTKNTIFFIIIITFIGCSSRKNTNSLFKDTYTDILSKEIFNFRSIRPPTFEEFQRGIEGPLPSKMDTINPLRLYVQKEHLDVNFKELKVKLPEDFKFIYQIESQTLDYLPEDIEQYSTKKYEFIEFVSLDEVSRNDITLELNYGGILQFSRALLNKERNKAILFVRDTYDKLDSVENIILLEKNNGKWEIFKSI